MSPATIILPQENDWVALCSRLPIAGGVVHCEGCGFSIFISSRYLGVRILTLMCRAVACRSSAIQQEKVCRGKVYHVFKFCEQSRRRERDFVDHCWECDAPKGNNEYAREAMS
jgi:hypothetical protein